MNSVEMVLLVFLIALFVAISILIAQVVSLSERVRKSENRPSEILPQEGAQTATRLFISRDQKHMAYSDDVGRTAIWDVKVVHNEDKCGTCGKPVEKAAVQVDGCPAHK